MPCSAIFFIRVYFCLEKPFKLTSHNGFKLILKEEFISDRKYGQLCRPIFSPYGYERKLGAIRNDNNSEEMTLIQTNTGCYNIRCHCILEWSEWELKNLFESWIFLQKALFWWSVYWSCCRKKNNFSFVFIRKVGCSSWKHQKGRKIAP